MALRRLLSVQRLGRRRAGKRARASGKTYRRENQAGVERSFNLPLEPAPCTAPPLCPRRKPFLLHHSKQRCDSNDAGAASQGVMTRKTS